MAKRFERPDTEVELSQLRSEIDRFDGWILALLRARGEVVMEIAQLKQRHGVRTRDPNREEEVLNALTRVPPSPFSAEEVRQVFQAIFSVSLRLQDPHPSKRNPRDDEKQADPP
ncbi:MAG: 3-deoxy-7-phosphoheptulonate synthase / chorismate mutase [Acidobacteriota bacterium]|jgi:chorismate mutase-like protein|nr:3-deoxy-7-phosphoheptulonate synthase / chorismate mutase [Acidobacteriota bacterium]